MTGLNHRGLKGYRNGLMGSWWLVNSPSYRLPQAYTTRRSFIIKHWSLGSRPVSLPKQMNTYDDVSQEGNIFKHYLKGLNTPRSQLASLHQKDNEILGLRKKLIELSEENAYLRQERKYDEESNENLKKEYSNAVNQLDVQNHVLQMSILKENDLKRQNVRLKRHIHELDQCRSVHVSSQYYSRWLNPDTSNTEHEMKSTCYEKYVGEIMTKISTKNSVLMSLDIMSKIREKDNEIERRVQENRALKQTIIDKNAKLREIEIKLDYEKTTNRRLQREKDEILKFQCQQNEIPQFQRHEFHYEDKDTQTEAKDSEMVRKFKTELVTLNKDLEIARLSHKDKIDKLLTIIKQKDSELESNEQTLIELRNFNDNLQSNILNLEEKLEEKSQECKDLETERKKETKEFNNRIMRLQKQIINGNDKQKELDQENKLLEKQMEEMRLRMENMQSTQFQKHNSDEGDIYAKLKTELKEVKSELEDAKIRLSKLMGQKLTDNNPNVADLSDKNRPTKLAERYTELYDNQWTDAFEIINDGDEKKTIMTLRQILQESMLFCESESTKQMKRLMKVIMLSGVECDVPRLVKKHLKDSRKTTAEASGKHLFKAFLKYLNRPGSPYADIADRIEKYTEECFQTCWLMCVQDPPVVLGKDLQEGVLFNTNVFKAYTRSGGVVDYVVWPALFLHEGGAMLCKGVAQGH